MADKRPNDQGAALLTVILLMSALFMLTTIVYGYALREYKLNAMVGASVQADIQVDIAISDVIDAIISRVDDNLPIENFTVSRNGLNGKGSNYYDCDVSGDGYYDSGDFVESNNVKYYVVDRTILEPIPDPIPEVMIDDIAVEITSVSNNKSHKRKLLVRVRSFVAETYDVRVMLAD